MVQSKAPDVSINIDPNESDLSIYRKELSSYNQCTFSCKNVGNLLS